MKKAVTIGAMCMLCVLVNCLSAQAQNRGFVARGNGAVILSGSGSAEFTCDGYLLVSSQTQVEVYKGTVERIELADGGTLYITVDGTVSVSGENMHVVCGGAGITVWANFSGRALTTGTGYYRTGLLVGLWNSEGVDILLD